MAETISPEIGAGAMPGVAISTLIAIACHTGYGHTLRLAEAVAAGVEDVAGARALLLPVEGAERHWGALAAANGIVFGAPTFMGAASARFKAFQDATSSAVTSKGHLWRDKIAAGFTNSGSRSGDKLSALIQMALFAAQHGMHWVGLDLPPGNNSSSGSERDLNRLGFWLGVGVQSNTDEGADTAPRKSDLATARHLGRRVATAPRHYVRGRAHMEG
jgi:multimeric flavodoxin WrbA